MESHLNLRTVHDNVPGNVCIICCKLFNKDVYKFTQATKVGYQKLKTCAEQRRSLDDDVFSLGIERILALPDADDNFHYHRDCYSDFTNKSKIERLRKRREKEANKDVAGSSSIQSKPRSTGNRLKTDWQKCVFCQDSTTENVRQVQTKNMEETLKKLMPYDYNLNLRLSGVEDLIAYEARYHTICLLKCTKLANKRKSQDPDSSDTGVGVDGKLTADNTGNALNNSLPFIQVCRELRVCATKGQVLRLCDVWARFTVLSETIGIPLPASFVSRRSTFKKKLQEVVSDVYDFYQPLDRGSEERKTLLIPIAFQHKLTSDSTISADDNSNDCIPAQETLSDFNAIVYAALKIRSDLMDLKGHVGLAVSKDSVPSLVPDSLFLFLSLLMKGQSAVDTFCEDTLSKNDYSSDDDDSGSDADNDSEPYTDVRTSEDSPSDTILSIAQDIVYAVGRKKKLTPKHIGLGLALHQATRSKKLVTLFHKAGHCLSYRQVLQVDSTLANITLQSLDEATGAVIPQNLMQTHDKQEPVVHLTVDNIDIITDTLDGKNTFHATQMVAFQRGCSTTQEVLENVKIDKSARIKIPPELSKLSSTAAFKGRKEPVFKKAVSEEWYRPSGNSDLNCESEATDLAFLHLRQNAALKSGWTEFNQTIARDPLGISQAGYMPLILNPAHEWDTLQTVIERSVAIADRLKQPYVVLTCDQALYHKLLEIKWASELFQNRVVLKMGGLHLALNFLRTIGQHMAGSGIREVWIESGVLAEGSAARVLDGKAYGKGLRVHKLTFQALWRILLDRLTNEECSDHFENLPHDAETMIEYFLLEENRKVFYDFVSDASQSSPNFAYWWSYLQMVSTLLKFTRAIRSGNWDLYLSALKEMLPFTARYDHTNYTKSLAVYIAEMHQLPKEVEVAFRKGDFGVQRSNGNFCQVDADHAQEWIVGICKKSGGLVGITQEESTLQRWALSFHWRSEITKSTFEMFGLGAESSSQGQVVYPGRRKRDNSDEDGILRTLRSFKVLSEDSSDLSMIHNVATKDMATDKIQDSLLRAHELGLQQVLKFISERLVCCEDTGKPKVSYHLTLSKNNPLTLKDLPKVLTKKTTQKAVLSSDKNVLQRIVMAYEAGRQIVLEDILKHELSAYPPSLTNMDGDLRSGDKSALISVLTKDLECPDRIDLEREYSHLLIDGMAMINALQKPAKCVTFGDYYMAVERHIRSYTSVYSRVDIVFDRYRPKSVKSTTRAKRSKNTAPVRRVIEDGSVPLPQNWKNFLALEDNKVNLVQFLSKSLSEAEIDNVELVIAGGFSDERKVFSNRMSSNVTSLEASHEEADTRLILHAVKSTAKEIVVAARDTDVLLLLIHHFGKLNDKKVWLMSGTAKNRKYIPIHEVLKTLSQGEVKSILAFHAITGSDVTSYLASVTKQAAFKVFRNHHHLLSSLGDVPLTDESISSAETFITRLYKVSNAIVKTDGARHALFGKVSKPEALPPTSDAILQHIKRCHWQTAVWENAHLNDPILPAITDCGWKEDHASYEPILSTLEPIPKAATDIVLCGCKKGCASQLCKCRKGQLVCTAMCLCCGVCTNSRGEN